MKKLLVLVLALCMVCSMAAAASAEKLVIYSPNPDEEIINFLDPFKTKYPEIEVDLQSMGTGECFTRLDAEKANPQADVLFGGVELSWTKDYPDLFETYVAAGNDLLPAEYQNPDGMTTYYVLGGSCVLIVNDELEA